MSGARIIRLGLSPPRLPRWQVGANDVFVQLHTEADLSQDLVLPIFDHWYIIDDEFFPAVNVLRGMRANGKLHRSKIRIEAAQ